MADEPITPGSRQTRTSQIRIERTEAQRDIFAGFGRAAFLGTPAVFNTSIPSITFYFASILPPRSRFNVARGIPAINTLILLSCCATATWAHWDLKLGRQGQLKLGLALTIALGILFIALQAHE